MSRNTVARIDMAALRHNLSRIKQLVGSSQVACVVKADAYGHGIARIAVALDGADLLAVATVGELQAVREAGWSGRVLLLEGFSGSEEYDQALHLQAEMVIHQADQLDLLEQRAKTEAQRLWLKLDTGMHRLGFPADNAGELLERIARLGPARDTVLMSHFACADDSNSAMTSAQFEAFQFAVNDLPGPRSLANSAAILNFPQSCLDVVRPGIMLYGISPIPGQTGLDNGLLPVMSLSCELLAINHCRAGDSIGYGARYQCPQDMRIGVAGIGYGDGYPRAMRDGAPVLVNGQESKLVGAVSMDLITVDLSDQDEAAVGDTVTLWGSGLPVEEVARWADTIPYTLVCGVTGRVRRVSV